MGIPPVLARFSRFLKTWALLLLLLQGAWHPAFSHGAHPGEVTETFGGNQAGLGDFHSQGPCVGQGSDLTQPARSCCVTPDTADSGPGGSDCGSWCCRRNSEARAAFEVPAQRVEAEDGMLREVGFKRQRAACCCALEVDLPPLEPFVPPTSVPSGGMVPEISWTTLSRMGPVYTPRRWDPHVVGEARILARVRAQRGARSVVHQVQGEAVEVLHCSFLL